MKFKNVLFAACAALTWSTCSIAQVPGNVPTNGLVGWWPFNGNANDESGNGHHGTIYGVILTEDRFGNSNSAYAFGDNDSYILTNPQLNTSQNFTLSCWINSNSNVNQTIINTIPHTIFAYGLNPWWAGTGTVGYLYGNGLSGGWLNSDYFINTNSSLDVWVNHVIIKNGTNWSFYQNGILIQSFLTTTDPASTLTQLVFGHCDPSACSEPFSGDLDDFALWNRVLSDAEIEELYIGCSLLMTSIVGSMEPFALETVQYNCNNNPGSTYDWSISNGVITDGQGTSNVTVLWGSEGPGSLTVIETNADGCSGNAATLDVNVVCATSATAISGPLGPNILTETTYSCDGSTSSAYQWSITNGVITSGQGTNTITVLWGATGLGSVSVQETTSANCMGDVITLNVVAIPTSIEHLSQTAFEAYHQSNLETIVIRSSQSGIGLTYSLFDRIGKQVATGKISNTITNVETNMLTPGVYVLRIGDIYEQSLLIIRE